jgi:CPA2 family monovalent cation:H+ antiporter-2
VVLLRTLEERGRLDSTEGRLAVSWVVVEDVVTVLALVLLPALAAPTAGDGGLAGVIARTVLSVGGFGVLMLFAGTRAIPWLLDRVARTGSRELFTLGVLAMALGIAVGAAALFDVSFALGAFLAGVVISESELSHQAAADALPLQDAFAVLFFVAAGMLVDPRVYVERPLDVALVAGMVLLWKPVVTVLLARALGAPLRVALPLAGSLAQAGEFSFVLSGLGVSLGVLPAEGRGLLLAGVLAAITLNPLVLRTLQPLAARLRARDAEAEARGLPVPAAAAEGLAGHVVLVGFGRVGATIGEALARLRLPTVVVERDRDAVDAARRLGLHVVWGNAARPGLLAAAGVSDARLLVVTTPEAFQARQVVRLALAANPALAIVVRTHRASEQAHLEALGVRRAMLGERELAYAMAHETVMALGHGDDAADDTVAALRRVEPNAAPARRR